MNESWVEELGELLGDATVHASQLAKQATGWTLSAAQAYFTRIKRVGFRVGLIVLVSLAVAALGAVSGTGWLMSVAVLVSVAALAVLLLLLFPVLVLAAQFKERFTGFSVAFKWILGFLTWGVGVALLLLVFPLTLQSTVIVMVASLFLTLFYLATGIGPDPRTIYRRVVGILVVTLILVMAKALIPQEIVGLKRLVGVLGGDILRAANVVSAPKRVMVQSLQQFEETTFVDSTGTALLYFVRGDNGNIELYNRSGVDGFGRELMPVTRDIVRQLREQIEKTELQQRTQQEQLRKQTQEQKMREVQRQRQIEETARNGRELEQKRQREMAEAAESERARQAQVQADRDREQRAAPAIARARREYARGNLLTAKEQVDSVLAKDPGNPQAVGLTQEWNLAAVCASCGSVVAIRPIRIEGSTAAVSLKDAIQQVAEASIGIKPSRPGEIVSVKRDDSRVVQAVVDGQDLFEVGDRVIATDLGRTVALSLQIAREGTPESVEAAKYRGR